MKKYFYLAMAIGLSFIPVLAFAEGPSLPMSLWGTATVNGSNVPVGTVVSSYNSIGVVYGNVTVTTAGLYGTNNLDQANPAEARLLFEGSGTITFKAVIPGYNSGEIITAVETKAFVAGVAERKDLSFVATSDNVCAAVANGEVGAYPSCTLTCNYGYSKDGNSCVYTSSSGSGSGSGSGASDVTAPAISNVVATPTSGTTATITWQTNENSLTWLNYGTTTAYGQQVKTASYTSSHSASLTGLTASTIYHYQVKSQDSSINSTVAADKTFTTLTAGQTASGSLGSGSGSATTTATTTLTREQLIALILQILAARGQGSTTGGTAGLSGIPSSFTFQNNLAFGITMIDVKYLQVFLNSNADTKVALTGVGSSGYETTKFGAATLAAVKKFQLKYGITTSSGAGYGLVGPATRAKLNSLLGR
ncbi:MAG: hypothetical protein WCX77_02170 [Candidatus Paceibacterota bacterium]